MPHHLDQAEWDHINETLKLLTLAVAQIEMSLTEGDQSINELSKSFVSLASQAEDISNELTTHQTAISELSPKLVPQTQDMLQHIKSAVVAFQFYDRISQRLDHVCQNLDGLSKVIQNDSERHNQQAWTKLQQDISSSYTMEAERLMFQHIQMGHNVEQALEIYHHHFDPNESHKKTSDGDEIELF